MREFELLPNEEQFLNMAREFNKVCVRKNVIKCGENANADDIARAYFLEMDLINATRVLYSKAQINLRESITNVIIAKRKNAERLLKMYVKARGDDMPNYASRQVNLDRFCNQLEEIDFMQERLVFLLNKIEDCNAELNKIINSELMISYIFCKIGIACNKIK